MALNELRVNTHGRVRSGKPPLESFASLTAAGSLV